MNRTLIALGVAATVALPVVAEAAPKIYGKLNLSVEKYEESFTDPALATDEIDMVRLQSNDSRFGVKGEEELTATLSAVYGIEWGVQGDQFDKQDMKQRNRFVGIKSQDFGTLKLGAYDTYLKQAQGKADFFNDLFGDMKYVIAGETRANNVVGYESPKFAGLQFNVMAQTQEEKNDTKGETKESKNGNSASIVYNNSDIGLYLALAMDNNVVGSNAFYSSSRENDNMRAVVVYKIADLTLSAVYNTSEDATATGAVSDEETGMLVGAAYKIGDQTLKAQYGEAENDDPADPVDRTLMNLGVDHNFNSKTRAYAFYTVKEESFLDPLEDEELTSFGLGLEHNF